MPAKDILYDAEARAALMRGASEVARAVTATLGPKGRTVVLGKKYGSPVVTKDGVTVAKEIDLAGHFENMGARLLREAASKTNDIAGDGTTTATLLAYSMLTEGVKNLAAGANGVLVKRGIDRATAAVVKALREMATPVDDKAAKQHIAAIAANDTQIGKLVAAAIERAGKEGAVTVEEGKGMETALECVDGLQFDKGYISPYFATRRDTMRAELENPLILIFEKKISSATELVPLLEKVARTGKPLLVIAEDVDGEALAVLVVNSLRGTLRACAVKAPGFGERRKAMLGDIGVVTGGRFISEDLGVKLENVELSDLGRARLVRVDKDQTVIVDGAGGGEAIKGRMEAIKREIEATDSDYDREKLQERLAKLSGGVTVIKVGAATETEMKEKKHRCEDAVAATRAAVAEGYVPGGGVALIRAAAALKGIQASGDEATGVLVVRRALEEPARRLAANAGANGSVVAQRIKESDGNNGYNVLSGRFEDLAAGGIIDPVRVVRVALENAASIAGMIVTTEVAVAEKPEPPKPPPTPHPHGG